MKKTESSKGTNKKTEKPSTSNKKKSSSNQKNSQKGIEKKLKKLEKQNKDLENSLIEKEIEIEALNEKRLRFAADFENYKKRTGDEIVRLHEYAGEKVLKEIIPILDDVERGVNTDSKSEKKDKNNIGLALIYKKLMKIMQDLGVEQIQSVGEAFDPDIHHAVMTREEKGFDADMVLEEYEKGYKFKKHILRYAKVVVSK